MISYPAVVVHGFDHACAALQPGRPVTLLSAYGAALFAGPTWWQALVAAARAEHPDTPACDLLDCADAPGRAMEALRIGLRSLILDPACPAFPAVSNAAAGLGGTVVESRPPALDLGGRGAQRHLARWLEGGDSTGSQG